MVAKLVIWCGSWLVQVASYAVAGGRLTRTPCPNTHSPRGAPHAVSHTSRSTRRTPQVGLAGLKRWRGDASDMAALKEVQVC